MKEKGFINFISPTSKMSESEKIHKNKLRTRCGHRLVSGKITTKMSVNNVKMK